MITTRQVTKRFGKVLAIDGVDLEVREGDRYGLLGPNGSGKTTLLRMLLGLVFATSGEIEVAGSAVPKHVGRVLPDIGAMIEGPAAYGYMSGRSNLALIDAAGPGGARRTRRKRIEEALERVGLAGVDRRPVRTYSLGMRQRLGLAAALLRTPRLLILDEPTNGLDPRGIREIRDLLTELNEAGATVLLSSHLLGEVEQLCTRIGVLDRGRLVIQDKLESLRAPTDRVVLHTPDAEKVAALLDGHVDLRDGDRLIVRAIDSAELNARLVGEGLRVSELARERLSLEEVVVNATQAGSDRIDLVRGRLPERMTMPGPVRMSVPPQAHEPFEEAEEPEPPESLEPLEAPADAGDAEKAREAEEAGESEQIEELDISADRESPAAQEADQ